MEYSAVHDPCSARSKIKLDVTMTGIQVFVEERADQESHRILVVSRTQLRIADHASFHDPNLRRSVCIQVQVCETVPGARDRCRRSKCLAKPEVNEPSLQIALGHIKARRTDLGERRMVIEEIEGARGEGESAPH